MQTLSMAAQSSYPANATTGLSQKLNKLIADGSLDYNSWRSLILEIETESPGDINTICLAYDSFLSTFPLCHWHLEKYAHHKAKLCGPQEAIDVYERGVEVAMFSVGFWVDYFTFGAACFGDPEDVRRLFRRAISFVDKDYLCHALWDKYMKYEFNLEGWSFLAHSYIHVLRSPTKKLQFYYDNFKQFVSNLEEEIAYENNNSIAEQVSVPCAAIEISADEISLVIKDLLDSPDRSVKSKALDRYRSIGEEFYQGARQMDEKIKCFEKKIQRRYFYATPLDDDQLNNWHLYLDFIEKQDNLDQAMKLYERCLISCACYPEFWMRYVDFMESKGGRELAISALNRATQIFLKNVPEIHLFSARFKEHIGDISGARAALIMCDTKSDSSFIENVVTLANLERRLGKLTAASATYEKALKNAKEKRRIHVRPSLYFHFAQLTYLTTGSATAARDVLIEGIQDVPHCRFLLEELIKFAMTHEGASQVYIIDPIIDNAISTGLDEYEGLSTKDRHNISHLFLEFVNLCGTIHDIRKAWNRHIKLFPQSLRTKTTYNLSTSGNYSIGLKTDQKDAEKVFESLANREIHPNLVPEKLSPPKDDGPADKMSCKSKEDEPGPMVVSSELADQHKESTLSAHEKEKPKQIDDSARLATQWKENILTPPQVHYKPERDGSAILQHRTPTNMNTGEDLTKVEHARQKSQLGDVQVDKESDQDGPTNQITSSANQQPWQEQQNMAMNQMLYHYHQQQLLQQQYQQQLSAYSQMQYNYYNQQHYQMPPHQQQNTQQSGPSYQHSQQNNQENFPQANEKQYYQSQDPAYQAYLLAYQQQGQQLLLQQYQQYQGYQQSPHQHQPHEGPMQEPHNSTHNLSQNQQGSRNAAQEYDATAVSSESPHKRARSPQELQ